MAGKETIRRRERRKHRSRQKDVGPAIVVACPYCGNAAEWVNNEVIYGKRYGASWKAYYCEPCDAYVGCHENTRRPKGTLANKETREWRIKAHDALDPFWKTKRVPRGKLYADIARDLGREIHIGECNPEQCREVIEWCRVYQPSDS